MDFKRQFFHNQVATWKNQYLDYSGLCKIIKRLKKQAKKKNIRRQTIDPKVPAQFPLFALCAASTRVICQ